MWLPLITHGPRYSFHSSSTAGALHSVVFLLLDEIRIQVVGPLTQGSQLESAGLQAELRRSLLVPVHAASTSGTVACVHVFLREPAHTEGPEGLPGKHVQCMVA